METKLKATPGPWQAEIATMHGKVIEYFVRVDGDEIAIASAICDRDGKPNQANARLIAAAPDLYAALSELEESCEYWSEYEVPLGIAERIKSALQKARGEQ